MARTPASKVYRGQPDHRPARVDGISGGTITSDGVDEMLQRTLAVYVDFFQSAPGPTPFAAMSTDRNRHTGSAEGRALRQEEPPSIARSAGRQQPDHRAGARDLLGPGDHREIENALVMSISVLFVLVFGNMAVSALRNLILAHPDHRPAGDRRRPW